MNIAYDHQIFGWQRFGGISRYCFELANHLADVDSSEVKCSIVSPLFVNEYLHYAGPALEVKGIAVPPIRRTGRLYRTINKLLAPLVMVRSRPDILHETYYSKTTVAPSNCRIILTVHDMIHELYPEYFHSWDPTRDEKKAAVERADHIICISENTQRDLIRLLGVPAEKTTVIYHGFALTQAKAATLAKHRRPYLLFVGLRGGYKNFDRVLKAYALRPSLREEYDLVAFGGGGFNAKELEFIHSLGLDGVQVRHVGGDDGVLAALYKQAAMFVYPSLYEGFGIPPLEAMSYDCPVACSNTSSIPEVVGDAAVQFDPLDVESIANTLEKLAGDAGLQTELRGLGRSRVALFSWKKCALKTLEVYRRMLAERP